MHRSRYVYDAKIRAVETHVRKWRRRVKVGNWEIHMAPSGVISSFYITMYFADGI